MTRRLTNSLIWIVLNRSTPATSGHQMNNYRLPRQIIIRTVYYFEFILYRSDYRYWLRKYCRDAEPLRGIA